MFRPPPSLPFYPHTFPSSAFTCSSCYSIYPCCYLVRLSADGRVVVTHTFTALFIASTSMQLICAATHFSHHPPPPPCHQQHHHHPVHAYYRQGHQKHSDSIIVLLTYRESTFKRSLSFCVQHSLHFTYTNTSLAVLCADMVGTKHTINPLSRND